MLMEESGAQSVRLTCLRINLRADGVATTGHVVHLRVGKHVLTRDVEVLPLVGIETAEVKTDLHLFAHLPFGAQGRKRREEAVFLLSLVIDIEVLRRLTAETLAQGIGREAVIVLADVAEERHLPLRRHFPGDIGLIIDVSRLIIAGGCQSAEHVFAGFVTQAVHLAVSAITVSDIDLCAQKTGAEASLERPRSFVGDIQHRRHLIAVLRTESAGREPHVLHHLGIDERESFLLTATDEKRTVHLDAVDID